MNNIKTITFLGTNAPDSMEYWYLDNGLLAYQAILYVPKGSVSSYTKALWITSRDTMHAAVYYNATMDFNIVESGNKQVQRFLVDGVLYRVTTYANAKPGKVYVKGFDSSTKNIRINKTVTYNGYTYNVIGIHKNVTDKLLDMNATIDSSITKRNLNDYFAS